jgi:hypothetical protein
VDVVDEVLELLERDERMRFTLDGQLATVDDYVEIRPEGEARIAALVRGARLAVGPWQTLVDEFLVSGETIVRNLEAGLERARDVGGAMRVGYLPDMFGHVAQMPQILRAAGIDVAVLWRGVPSVVDSHRFEWEGIDGSVVRGEYMPEEGYSNMGWTFDPDGERLDAAAERLRPWFGDDPILGMVGTDHKPVVRDLPERVGDRTDVQIRTLADYVADVSQRDAGKDVVRVTGELRSGARANLLPNVVSARIDIKQACARAERVLERYAEPRQALYGGEWPEAYLRLAWSRLFQNAAHDSICGCSADAVSAQVLVRYAEAEQIGTELANRVLARAAAKARAGSFVVFNPSPFMRTELVEPEPGVASLVTAPPLGWTTFAPQHSDRMTRAVPRIAGTVMCNGPFELDLASIRIVDDGDFGDSYNYAPPAEDTIVDEPCDERIERSESDRFRARLVLRRTYRWPRGLGADGTRRAPEAVPVDVELSAELRTNEPFVRIEVAFDNPCDDHRVRVHVPLSSRAETTHAEGQFAVVERLPEQEGGYGEQRLVAYPASAFVAAGGIALLLDHVTEYELVDGRELALTALRSVGLISRAANPFRRVNAGPELPIPAAQMHGPRTFSFAWCPDPERALEHAERYRHPFLVVPGNAAEGDLPERAGPELRGAMLTALRRRDGVLEARVLNATASPSDARLARTELPLRPWEIRTVRLDDQAW